MYFQIVNTESVIILFSTYLINDLICYYIIFAGAKRFDIFYEIVSPIFECTKRLSITPSLIRRIDYM